MVYTLTDHKMTSKMFKTKVRRGVSLQSFEHFMASFYGLKEHGLWKTAVAGFVFIFTITWRKHERDWLFFSLRKRACYI